MAPFVESPNFDSILARLQSNGLSLQSASQLSSWNKSGNNSEFINCVFDMAQNAEAFAEGGDEQKVQASINIIEGLLGMISFSANKTQQARQKVTNNADSITKTGQKADQAKDEVDAKVQAIMTEIASNTTNIQNAIAEIEKLGGDNGKIQDLKLQIEMQLEIIDEAKEELKDPEKHDSAIQKIKSASAAIDEIVTTGIPAIQAAMEAQTAVVNQNVDEIASKLEQSAQTISEGVEKIQACLQEGAKEGQDAVQIGVEGGKDTATGVAEISAAEALQNTPYLNTAAQTKIVKLNFDGNQNKSAGGTETSGSARNISSVTITIGDMGQDISEVSQYLQSIAQVGNGVNGLVDSYNNAYIAAVGTWNIDNINAANEQLQKEVKELEEEPAEAEAKLQNQGKQTNGNSADPKKEFLDTKVMRAAFGI